MRIVGRRWCQLTQTTNLDSVVDALHHDLEDHVFSPLADLICSAPRKRSPMGREPRVSPAVEVSPDDEHMIRPINGRYVVPRLEHESVDGSTVFLQVFSMQRVVPLFQLLPEFWALLVT